MCKTIIIHERPDKVKITRGMRGNYGFELEISGDCSTEEGQEKMKKILNQMIDSLNARLPLGGDD